MSVTERKLSCGCRVYEEDGRGPWPVDARTVLASEKGELCRWAWETSQAMADAYFDADGVTEEVLEASEALRRHALEIPKEESK